MKREFRGRPPWFSRGWSGSKNKSVWARAYCEWHAAAPCILHHVCCMPACIHVYNCIVEETLPSLCSDSHTATSTHIGGQRQSKLLWITIWSAAYTATQTVSESESHSEYVCWIWSTASISLFSLFLSPSHLHQNPQEEHFRASRKNRPWQRKEISCLIRIQKYICTVIPMFRLTYCNKHTTTVGGRSNFYQGITTARTVTQTKWTCKSQCVHVCVWVRAHVCMHVCVRRKEWLCVWCACVCVCIPGKSPPSVAQKTDRGNGRKTSCCIRTHKYVQMQIHCRRDTTIPMLPTHMLQHTPGDRAKFDKEVPTANTATQIVWGNKSQCIQACVWRGAAVWEKNIVCKK